MIRQTAGKYGIDPDIAVRVARSEGGAERSGAPVRRGQERQARALLWPVPALHGRRSRQPGAGGGHRSAQPRAHRAELIDFALKEASQKGWGQWYGAKRVGIGNYQGIGRTGGDPNAATPAFSPAGGSNAATPVVAPQAQPKPGRIAPGALDPIVPGQPAPTAAQPAPAPPQASAAATPQVPPPETVRQAQAVLSNPVSLQPAKDWATKVLEMAAAQTGSVAQADPTQPSPTNPTPITNNSQPLMPVPGVNQPVPPSQPVQGQGGQGNMVGGAAADTVQPQEPEPVAQARAVMNDASLPNEVRAQAAQTVRQFIESQQPPPPAPAPVPPPVPAAAIPPAAQPSPPAEAPPPAAAPGGGVPTPAGPLVPMPTGAQAPLPPPRPQPEQPQQPASSPRSRRSSSRCRPDRWCCLRVSRQRPTVTASTRQR